MEDQFSITQNSVSDHLTFLPSSSSASSSSASTQRTCHICHARESLTSAELGLLIAKASSSSNPLATKWLHWKCVTPLILRQISNTQSITNCETLPAHIQFRIQRSLLRGTVNESLSTSHQPKPSTPLFTHIPQQQQYSHTIFPPENLLPHHLAPQDHPPQPLQKCQTFQHPTTPTS
ncbi:hypothetical protein BCR33DRAFT_565528 [Rhizoclosmatium globosum]|uniref:PARP-type domain-containing protein n=1 Tax=Rhizoclosmatium globosum TaxID=329046 RepID=A0A1Y2B7C6_9FUNG|nr:hypothetical protein BCR33DRAFT_565528 [Rhizoclosmatium globosum]|eukprot:ORY30742.1 hypothetical protein BCR33DRAFT_565528 [Rhizoclosmatium globosum]